jgi:hypothetical protein
VDIPIRSPEKRANHGVRAQAPIIVRNLRMLDCFPQTGFPPFAESQ